MTMPDSQLLFMFENKQTGYAVIPNPPGEQILGRKNWEKLNTLADRKLIDLC